MKVDVKWLRTGILALVCLAFASALAALIWKGIYARYLADDYCYDIWFTGRNFWQAWISSYYLPNPFAGHRLSLTLFSGFGKLLGVPSAAWFTVLSVIFITAGMAWTVDGIKRCFRISLTWLEVILIAEVLVSLTLFQAPNRYQILFWRTGLLTYLAPLVFQSFLYGLILFQSWRKPGSRWLTAATVLLAMTATGFSETAGAFQATLLMLCLLTAVWLKRAGSSFAARFSPALTAALLATVLMLVIMFVCPTNAPRMQVGQVQTYDPVRVLLISGRFGFDFLRDTVRGLPLPTAFTLALFAILAFFQHDRLPVISLPKAAAGFFASFIVGYILLMAAIAPSVVAQSSFPELRALLIGRFALVLMFAGMGASLGLMVRPALMRPGSRPLLWIEPAALILLAILSLYAFRMTIQASREVPAAQVRASIWDSRDQMLRAYHQQGQQAVVVNAMDAVGRIFELQENPGHWVNQCAEVYYGILSISAVER